MCKKVTSSNLESVLLEREAFDSQLTVLQEAQAKELAAINKKYSKQLADLTKKVTERDEAVELYATENKAELFSEKVRNFKIGKFVLSFRKCPDTLLIADEEATIALLEKFKFTKCVKTVKKVILNSVKALSDAEKKQVKVKVVEGQDVFSITY